LRQKVTSLLVGGYILLCIILGGSSQSPWPGLALDLLGLVLISWAGLHWRTSREQSLSVGPYLLLLFGLLIVLVQLIPLPANLWSSLPGRADLAKSIEALGFPLQPLPISETPYTSVLTLFSLMPAIAAFVAVERLSPSPRVLAVAIVVGMLGGVFLGAAQVAGGQDSWANLYAIHSSGASGFFANHNHMATLLLVGIPMIAALVVSAKSDRKKTAFGRFGIGVAVLIVIIVGIVLTGTRAAIALAVPIVVASMALFPAMIRWRRIAFGVTAVTLVVAVAIVVANPIMSTTPDSIGTSNVSSRVQIWSTTAKAIRDSFPIGTGLGSFEQVYHAYENPESVGGSYVNHAHNDYLELILELGAAGLVLIVCALAWWVIAVVRIWRSSLSSPIARAATIATAAILAHSFVDFPIRTGAISAIFAVCVALMAQHRRPTLTRKPGESRPARHMTIG
jgi:O-antigen ligase